MGGVAVVPVVSELTPAVVCVVPTLLVSVSLAPACCSIGEACRVGGANIPFGLPVSSRDCSSLMGERIIGDVGVSSESLSAPSFDICEYIKSPGYWVQGG